MPSNVPQLIFSSIPLVICELKEVNSFVSLIEQMSEIGNILKTKPEKYVLNNSAADS